MRLGVHLGSGTGLSTLSSSDPFGVAREIDRGASFAIRGSSWRACWNGIGSLSHWGIPLGWQAGRRPEFRHCAVLVIFSSSHVFQALDSLARKYEMRALTGPGSTPGMSTID